MIPTRLCIYVLLAAVPLALIASYSSVGLTLLKIFAIAMVVIFVVEYLLMRMQSKRIEILRRTASSWSLGVPTAVTLEIANRSSSAAKLSCYDMLPNYFKSEDLPVAVDVDAKQMVKIKYKVQALYRGDFTFSGVHCRLQKWLWEYQFKHNVESEVRIFPNFAAEQQLGMLAGATADTQIDATKRQQRGSGTEFHQLREYRDGDPLRTIDWKASSRLQKLIAKEYQDETDQQIVVLLDCGKRMSHTDGEFSHLDETLNAIILLSHLANKQGDSIGLMTFGGIDRWVAPVKGAGATQKLLSQMYDLQPTVQVPDFTLAASQLMQRLKKRALVIVVTNTRNDEQPALVEAITLLRKRHLVLLADMQETVVSELANQPVYTEDDASGWLGASHYLVQRRNFHARLKGHGALIVDTPPKLLPSNLISRYFQIKALGKL